MITYEEAHRLFIYDDETGVLTHRVSRRGGVRAGAPVGCANDDGYLLVMVGGKSYRVHRIIMLMAYGEWPPDYVDHLNGDTSDNRLANLQAATRTQNGRNRRRSINNSSGVTGVVWNKQTRKWVAQIRVDGKCRHLGYYDSIPEAASARYQSERDHGFSETHGRRE